MAKGGGPQIWRKIQLVCFQLLWLFSDEVYLILKVPKLAVLWPLVIPDSKGSFAWQRVRGRDTLQQWFSKCGAEFPQGSMRPFWEVCEVNILSITV